MVCVFSVAVTVTAMWQRKPPLSPPVKKTVIITGANRGIGFSAAKQLASTNDYTVIFACRSKERAQKALETLKSGAENIEIRELDLADLKSVRKFADSWGNKPIDCLALNAGIQTGSTKIPMRSAQGYEMTVATNHLGHFLLTNLLLKNVKLSPAGRVVVVGSGGKINLIVLLGTLPTIPYVYNQ